MEILFLLGLGKLKANWLYSLNNILLPPKQPTSALIKYWFIGVFAVGRTSKSKEFSPGSVLCFVDSC